MMGLFLFIHVTACVLLITLVLIQSGRGGGLVEGFAGVESMFGPKTNAFLTRATTVLSIIFFVSCLTLAALSFRNSLSIMKTAKPRKEAKQTTTVPAPATTTPAAAQAVAPTTPTPAATIATSPQETPATSAQPQP